MIKDLFGTDGIRAPVGTSPFTLPELIYLGYGIGRWVCEKYRTNKPRCLIVSDTRASASFIKHGLSAGLMAHSLILHDGGIIPTPAACFLALHHHYQVVFVISASHNPACDNGIKVIDGVTGKIDPRDQETISTYFYQPYTPPPRYDMLGQSLTTSDLPEIYCHALISLFPPSFLESLSVVLDCAQGATYAVAPFIFKALGAHVTSLHNEPTGYNINAHCGSLYAENIVPYLSHCKASIGFAFDGDGDRVIAVLPDGTILDGDYILSLLYKHPRYCEQQGLVGTILSNAGLDYTLSQKNKKLMRSAVGDKAVADMLEKENLLLGGEPSGHIIMRDYLYTGDGIFTALRLLEVILPYLTTVSSNLFKKFPHVTANIPVTTTYDLEQSPFSDLITQYQKKASPGRLVMRYSGTEPLLRIMVEHENQSHAQKILNDLVHEYLLLVKPVRRTRHATKTPTL